MITMSIIIFKILHQTIVSDNTLNIIANNVKGIQSSKKRSRLVEFYESKKRFPRDSISLRK